MSSNCKLDNFKQMQVNDFHYYKTFLNYTNIFTTRNNVVGPLDSFNIKAEKGTPGWLSIKHLPSAQVLGLSPTSGFLLVRQSPSPSDPSSELSLSQINQ